MIYQAPYKNQFSEFRINDILTKRKISMLKKLVLAAAISAISSMSALAEEEIKVGVLHSLSGTMAISETTLKDTMLMLIEELNGLLFYPVQYEGEESSKNDQTSAQGPQRTAH